MLSQRILVEFSFNTYHTLFMATDTTFNSSPMPTSYPLRATALAQLAQFVEGPILDYAQRRNFDDGPDSRNNVSCLSAYIRNRVITEEEVVQAVLQRHSYNAVEKFIQEVFWRTYWKGWLELRPAVWSRYCEAIVQLQQEYGHFSDYLAACHGNTGIACYDAWVNELVHTGYLHNHARMWFASIWIFTLNLPWQLGAHFFLRHLRDGDPATNTLSWRWVAGLHTQGKHYLARTANIAQFTHSRFSPHQLNETAAPVTEDEPLPQPVWRELHSADKVANKRCGLVVTDDDVALDQAWMLGCEHAIGVIDKAVYDAHEIANAVFQYRHESLQQSVASWATEKSIQHTLTEKGDTEQLVQWATAAKLECVAIVQPTVGLLYGWICGLEEALAAAGIELIRTRKLWDLQCYPHAKRGFFAFKKEIPRILDHFT